MLSLNKLGKKRMKKIIGFGVFVFVFFLVAGVFASAEIVSSDSLASMFAKEVASKSGISESDVKNVTEVDLNELPEGVDVKDVGDSNVGIYSVDYEKNNEDKQLFVVTYSTEKLGSRKVVSDNRQYLNFGKAGEMVAGGFLDTATGVGSSANQGYVMMRDGSVTGMSTNLKVNDAVSNGEIEVIIYKNGEAIRFGNVLDASDKGTAKDYDVQSKGVVSFEAGDLISVYVVSEGGVAWQDVITMLEITTD